MHETVLATNALTKRYGRRNVVDGVNLTVRSGEIYGFLGPNGAGKTTTLRMVTGLISPSSGSIELLGQNPARSSRAIMRQIGCLIEGPAFYPHLSGAQNLHLMQTLKGIGHDEKEVRELLDLVNLSKTGHQPVERYSLGMKQRLGIAMALLGRPSLLILDEPTNGLDPEGFREIRALLRHLASERGITVLLSSHLLHEVEQVASRVGVIREGRLLIEASVEELRHQSQQGLEIGVDRAEAAADLIRERTKLPVEQVDGGTLVVRGKAHAAQICALLVRNDHNVSRLVEREASLEEIFFHLTGGTAHA